MRVGVVSGSVIAVVIAFTGWTAQSQQAPGQQPGQQGQVTKEQFDRWMTELSNWGRWGKDDQLGALNLITAAKRQQAAALVKTGTVVSLSRNLTPEPAAEENGRRPPVLRLASARVRAQRPRAVGL